jgi:cytochrome c553
MIRILPITILFLLAFVGFIAFKSYNNAVADQQTEEIVAQLAQDLSQLEPAAGDKAKEKEEGSGKTGKKRQC